MRSHLCSLEKKNAYSKLHSKWLHRQNFMNSFPCNHANLDFSVISKKTINWPQQHFKIQCQLTAHNIFPFFIFFFFYHEKPQSEGVDQPPPVEILQVPVGTTFHLVLLNRTSQGEQSGNSSRYQVRNTEMPPPQSPRKNIKGTQNPLGQLPEKYRTKHSFTHSLRIFIQYLPYARSVRQWK